MSKWIGLVCACVLLAGCRADDVDLKLSIDQLRRAIDGQLESVEFEAKFSQVSEIDEDYREKIEKLDQIARRYLRVDDFRIERNAVYIEGQIPIFFGPREQATEQASPWVLSISRN